jgi:hypothetical protein
MFETFKHNFYIFNFERNKLPLSLCILIPQSLWRLEFSIFQRKKTETFSTLEQLLLPKQQSNDEESNLLIVDLNWNPLLLLLCFDG